MLPADITVMDLPILSTVVDYMVCVGVHVYCVGLGLFSFELALFNYASAQEMSQLLEARRSPLQIP